MIALPDLRRRNRRDFSFAILIRTVNYPGKGHAAVEVLVEDKRIVRSIAHTRQDAALAVGDIHIGDIEDVGQRERRHLRPLGVVAWIAVDVVSVHGHQGITQVGDALDPAPVVPGIPAPCVIIRIFVCPIPVGGGRFDLLLPSRKILEARGRHDRRRRALDNLDRGNAAAPDPVPGPALNMQRAVKIFDMQRVLALHNRRVLLAPPCRVANDRRTVCIRVGKSVDVIGERGDTRGSIGVAVDVYVVVGIRDSRHGNRRIDVVEVVKISLHVVWITAILPEVIHLPADLDGVGGEIGRRTAVPVFGQVFRTGRSAVRHLKHAVPGVAGNNAREGFVVLIIRQGAGGITVIVLVYCVDGYDIRRICGECCGDERERGQRELGGAAINVRNRPPPLKTTSYDFIHVRFLCCESTYYVPSRERISQSVSPLQLLF